MTTRPKKRATAEANFRALYRSYNKSARKRGLSFELDADRFRELTKQDCFICGQAPTNSYKHDDRSGNRVPYVYNGVDRINNSNGYVEGNVAPCCGTCNFAKGKGSLTDLLLYIYRAYHHALKPTLDQE